MAESESQSVRETPEDLPLRLWFGGILEGPRSGAEMDALLREVTREIRALHLGHAELELDGGRFSILLGDEVLPGDRLDESKRERFMAELQRVLDASPDAGRLESTLRCTEIHADHAFETIFAPHDGRMEGFGRNRDLKPEDARGQVSASSSRVLPSEYRSKKSWGILAAVVLLVGLLAWQRGVIDRIFAGDASELTVATEGLMDSLAIDVESSWGNYEVQITRGKDYPETTKDRQALLDRSKTPASLAMLRAVTDGGRLFVRLEDAEGKVLEATEVDLRGLLESKDAKVRAVLPGRMRAAVIRISLVNGKQP